MNNSTKVIASSSSSYYGSEGCECIDVSQTLLSLDDRLCTLYSTTITTSSNTNNNTAEDEGILLTIDGPCVPLSFGSNYCAAHDIMNDPECMTRGVISQELCNVPFCYVDSDSCRLSDGNERVYRSSYFGLDHDVDVFYSYTTCNSTFNDYTYEPSISTLNGMNILATVPTAYFPPYTFKRDNDGNILTIAGEEYYNDSIPFEGVLINYLNALQDLSNNDFTINYTYGSKAAKLVHPTSAYTEYVTSKE